MKQLSSVWKGLTVQRRAIVVAATVAMFAAVLGLARMATSTDLTLLYSGLENGAAGDVVAALEARGVAYEVRGGAIFVDEARRDELRMTLASEGLPEAGTEGYEILDRMTGFGTTSQMFDAAYWRAKEGELARTIVASPTVRAARVHIANSGTKPFQRDLTPSASVTVTPAAGGLDAQQAKALRYLVASAVSGLRPDAVSVIDATGGVILSATGNAPASASGADRAERLKRNVERLLEARVGYGKAVVEVNVDTVTESEQILERRVDPESRVAISQDVSQTEETSSDPAGGGVTVASNLPDGDAAEEEQGQSSRNSSESRERTNFEVSETERQVTRVPGAVARITAAVMIDGIRETGPEGEVEWAPRPEAEMEALRELVGAAIGFDESRGDTLSIRSMQFEPLPEQGTAPIAASLFGPVDTMRLIQLAILALVVIVLALFVIRPLFARREEPAAPALEGPEGDLPANRAPALTGEIDPAAGPRELATSLASRNEADGAVRRLRQLIDERQDESLKVLRSWMEDEEKA